MTLPGIDWKGKEVWVIGGGMSIPYQFHVPNTIVQGVKSGVFPMAVYAQYMISLFHRNILGINSAYLLGNWVDVVFFGDEPWWNKNKDGVLHHPGVLVSCNDSIASSIQPKIINMKRDRNKPLGININSGMVSWNYNSGCASLSLLAQLGVSRIILLGFDMNGGKGHTHFHGEYGWIKKSPAFDFHLRGMPQIASDAKNLGIEILNASPDSAIKEFKKVTVDELLL